MKIPNLLRSLALLSVSGFALTQSSLQAQAVFGPGFDGGQYSLRLLGPAPTVPTPYGGMSFLLNSTNTLLLGGSAVSDSAAIYRMGVLRDATKHAVGLTNTFGATNFFASAPGRLDASGIDGGLGYGPGNVLFYTSYDDNSLNEIAPGGTAPALQIDLSNKGILGSVGSFVIVPTGFPGAGRIKILEYLIGAWYDGVLSPSGNLYDVTITAGDKYPIGIGGGPEGAVYVAAGLPGFTNDSVLIFDVQSSSINAYDVDSSGDPILSTSRLFLSPGASSPLGPTRDPVTGDILFNAVSNDVAVVYAIQMPTGTPPTVKAKLSATYVNGQIKLSVIADPGHTFEIQYSTDLKSWLVLKQVTTTAASTEFTDPALPTGARRFYKARTIN
jgi:hypothetical protein